MADQTPNQTQTDMPTQHELSGDQFDAFLLSGKLPDAESVTETAEHDAGAATATPVDQVAATAVNAKAAPEAAKPEKVKEKGQKKSASQRAEELEREADAAEERVRVALRRRREALDAERDVERSEPSRKAEKAGEAAAPTTKAERQAYRDLPGAPKSDQFDTLDEYVEAMGVFIADKRADERFDVKFAEREQQWQAEARSQSELDARVDESFTRARAEIAADPEIVNRIDPRWVAVATKLPSDPSCTPIEFVKANVALHARRPLAVAAHFATDEGLKELNRVCRLGNPEHIIRELAYIDAKFDTPLGEPSGEAAGERQHPRVSKAPAPSPTLGKKATAGRDPLKAPDTFEDFDSWNLETTKSGKGQRR